MQIGEYEGEQQEAPLIERGEPIPAPTWPKRESEPAPAEAPPVPIEQPAEEPAEV